MAISWHETRQVARPLFALALGLVLPPRCAGCGVIVATCAGLCQNCWSGLTFLGAPCCARCGFPFELDHGEGMICIACHRNPPAFDRARAALRYDADSRGLLIRFKHADRIDLAPMMARWLQAAGREVLAEADLLVPVPLHWTRLARRRYNQAALLANQLARLEGLPVTLRALRRNRRTPSLGHLGPTARTRILQGALSVVPSARTKIQGQRILLIDDVFTSGSTAAACSRVLRQAGATGVDVLTVARSIQGMP